MEIILRGIDTEYVEAIRDGGLDANGQVAVRQLAVGTANPCRHCLDLIAEGEQKLVLAYCPFTRIHPYAEVGPIFLHAKNCERYESDKLTGWFAFFQPALIRGYGLDDWIRYETGSVVPGDELTVVASKF